MEGSEKEKKREEKKKEVIVFWAGGIENILGKERWHLLDLAVLPVSWAPSCLSCCPLPAARCFVGAMLPRGRRANRVGTYVTGLAGCPRPPNKFIRLLQV